MDGSVIDVFTSVSDGGHRLLVRMKLLLVPLLFLLFLLLLLLRLLRLLPLSASEVAPGLGADRLGLEEEADEADVLAHRLVLRGGIQWN